MVLMPSSFGILVYSDRTSRVTRKQSLASVAGTLSSSVRKWLVSLRWDLMVFVYGCRWKSTYSEIFEVGLLIELTSGLPGLPSLWTLGRSFRIVVLGLLTFKPSAILSVTLC